MPEQLLKQLEIFRSKRPSYSLSFRQCSRRTSASAPVVWPALSPAVAVSVIPSTENDRRKRLTWCQPLARSVELAFRIHHATTLFTIRQSDVATEHHRCFILMANLALDELVLAQVLPQSPSPIGSLKDS
jgi:hypothetical protein